MIIDQLIRNWTELSKDETTSYNIRVTYAACADALTLAHPAALLAAEERGRVAEREECAKIAEGRHIAWQADEGTTVCCDVTACEDIASEIRARASTDKDTE